MGRRNAYLALGSLATHPSFRLQDAALRCPLCPSVFSRVRDFDTHLLEHDPDPRLAFQAMSARSLARVALERGWPLDPDDCAQWMSPREYARAGAERGWPMDPEQAERHLPRRRYEQLAAERGWPDRQPAS